MCMCMYGGCACACACTEGVQRVGYTSVVSQTIGGFEAFSSLHSPGVFKVSLSLHDIQFAEPVANP